METVQEVIRVDTGRPTVTVNKREVRDHLAELIPGVGRQEKVGKKRWQEKVSGTFFAAKRFLTPFLLVRR